MKAARQTVLITGPTSGLGYDFARIFAERGYDLFLASRNHEKLSEVKNQLETQFDVSAETMPIDLSRGGSARELYDETVCRGIDVSVLVNNAGIGLAGEVTEMDAAKVAGMIHLNITTLTELCAFFGRGMKERRKGYILNVSSTAAYQPTPFISVYGATKSFVLNFSEALAKEMEDFNVGVTCLSPGPTETGFFDGIGVQGLRERRKGLWAKDKRMESREVAEIGVNALFAGKLSVVAGNFNSLFAFSTRLAPRQFAAVVSKWVMKQAIGD